MSGSYGLRAAAHKDADLMVRDLNYVSGLLEEVATIWRRAELYGRQSSSTAPGHLQEAAKNLAALLRAVPDADCGQHPAQAFSAVAQLAALETNAALSEAVTVTGGSHLGDAGLWAAIQGALLRVRKQLWSLISCLVKIGDTPATEDVMAGQNSR
jgi:hypothetical protein